MWPAILLTTDASRTEPMIPINICYALQHTFYCSLVIRTTKPYLNHKVFNSFKINNYFSYKDPIPDDLKSFLVHKFTWASHSSSDIGKTCCHFKTKIEEHIKKDNNSHIFKHLHYTTTCFYLYNSPSFKIIDKVNSKFNLKIKEVLYINWGKPSLNAQQNN